jgi:hypothetical protein
MAVLVLVEGVAIALLAVLVAGLLRSHAQVLASLHQLTSAPRHDHPVAAPQTIPPRPDAAGGGTVTDVVGVAPDDESVAIAVRSPRVDTLLAFLSTGCSTCASLWTGLQEGEGPALPDRTRLVVVTLGPGDESPARLRRMQPAGVPVVMSSDAWQDYQVPGAPYFIWIDGTEGRVRGEGSARSWPEVSSLMGDAAADAGDPRNGDPRNTDPRNREQRVDAELAAAGILPGDPRLYHQ